MSLRWWYRVYRGGGTAFIGKDCRLFLHSRLEQLSSCRGCALGIVLSGDEKIEGFLWCNCRELAFQVLPYC